MPLRDLFYVAKLLRKITSDDDLYSGKLIKIPAPRFYVFYNGTSPMPDRQVFRLSDQFEKTIEKPDLELAVTVLNINDGHNTELMKSCSTLKEYSIFVALVRQYTKEIPKDADDKNEAIKAAISKAIDKCVADGILSDFLTQHREKVMEVCMWDYNEQLHEKTIQTESYDKALADVFKVMLSNGYSLEDTKKIEDALKKSHETSSSN
nr:hypothetical protein [uncultured Butyrivibrio sp.]